MAEGAYYSQLYTMFAREMGLDKQIQQDLIKWFENSNEVKIFITGKTGAGKSTLVNALVRKKVAKEGESLDRETSAVTTYSCNHRFVNVTVWHSPALQDGTNQEGQYLEDMKAKCSDMDLSIYCVSLKETRFFEGCPDVLAMKKLTNLFGKRMWKNAMFVLTFANLAEDLDPQIFEEEDDEKKAQLFKDKIQRWKEILTGALINDVGVDKEVAERIEVVPAGHEKIPELLDRPHWLSPVWFAALYAMNSRAQPAMVKLNYHRIGNSPDEIRAEDFTKFIEKQTLIFAQRGE